MIEIKISIRQKPMAEATRQADQDTFLVISENL